MKKILLITGIILITFTCCLYSQVMLIPTVAFFDPESKTASMEIANASPETREITISFKFGYFTYTDDGKPYMNYSDTIIRDKYSLNQSIRVFPQKLVIPPNERQTVRFLLSNPAKLKNNIYWTRVVATSSPITKQIDTLVPPGQVAATMIVKTEMVGLIIYAKEKMKASLDLSLVNTSVDTTKFNVLLKEDKNGDAPFWGSIKINIFDSENNKVLETEEPAAIYFSCKQIYSFDKSKFKTGNYKLKMTVINKRDEIPEDLVSETPKKDFVFNISYP